MSLVEQNLSVHLHNTQNRVLKSIKYNLGSNPGFPFQILSRSFGNFLQSCETKSRTESLNSRVNRTLLATIILVGEYYSCYISSNDDSPDFLNPSCNNQGLEWMKANIGCSAIASGKPAVSLRILQLNEVFRFLKLSAAGRLFSFCFNSAYCTYFNGVVGYLICFMMQTLSSEICLSLNSYYLISEVSLISHAQGRIQKLKKVMGA